MAMVDPSDGLDLRNRLVTGITQNIMKRRHTDVPHTTDSSADTSVTAQLRALRTRTQPATPVEAAAALIELALHESNAPVEDLSQALGRLAQAAQGVVPRNPPDSLAPREREQLARDVAICIESLQFHDRLTQQLTQVRNLLATLVFDKAPTGVTGRPQDDDPHSWEVLLENLRARFTSESHRILFNLLLPAEGGRAAVPSLHANEGSVELF